MFHEFRERIYIETQRVKIISIAIYIHIREKLLLKIFTSLSVFIHFLRFPM